MAIELIQNKNVLKGFLEKDSFQESLQAVASRFITHERAAKLALLAASRQPKLWKCTAGSFLRSVIQGTELGLEFGGSSGQAYLIPYKNKYLSAQAGRDVYECQFMPGYRGFIELAYRSGHVTFIDAQLVYEADEFDYGYDYGQGKSPFIHHKPSLGGDRGFLVCAYSVISLTDSPMPKIDFMSLEELDTVRECSKSKNDGPWKTFPGEMRKKTILRRSIKWIPTTPELTQAEEADNSDYDLGVAATVVTDRRLGTDGLKHRLAASLQPEKPTEADVTVGDGLQKTWMCANGHAFSGQPADGECPECGDTDIEPLVAAA